LFHFRSLPKYKYEYRNQQENLILIIGWKQSKGQRKWDNGMKKYLSFMLFGLFLMTALTGCNTVHGAGQDISNTGHNIEHAAN
jgi:predicted small secreted protein